MCEIQRRQKEDRKSLGVFRPESIHDLVVSSAPSEFEASQRAIIEQGSLLGDRAGDNRRAALEPLPVKAKFDFLSFCDATRDVRFITGSMLRHPGSFLILELVYPKRQPASNRNRSFEGEARTGTRSGRPGRPSATRSTRSASPTSM